MKQDMCWPLAYHLRNHQSKTKKLVEDCLGRKELLISDVLLCTSVLVDQKKKNLV